MPMFWLNETMQLDAETAQDVYDKSGWFRLVREFQILDVLIGFNSSDLIGLTINLVKPMKIVNSLQYTMFAVGGALIIIALIDAICVSDDSKVEDEEKKQAENPYDEPKDDVKEESM